MILFDNEKLKELREQANLTYKELANELRNKYKIQCNYASVKSWEEGLYNPSFQAIVSLCRYFNTDLEYWVKQ